MSHAYATSPCEEDPGKTFQRTREYFLPYASLERNVRLIASLILTLLIVLMLAMLLKEPS
jgi:hypothetical protein